MGASRADDVTVGAGNQQFVHLEAVSPADYSPFELEFLDAIRKGVEAAGVSTDRVAVRLVSLFSDRPGTQATGSPDPLVTAIGDGGDRTYRVHVTPARLLAEGWKIAHPDGVDAVSRTVAIDPITFDTLAEKWADVVLPSRWWWDLLRFRRSVPSALAFLPAIFEKTGSGPMPFSANAAGTVMECVRQSLPLLKVILERTFSEVNDNEQTSSDIDEVIIQDLVPSCLK